MDRLLESEAPTVSTVHAATFVAALGGRAQRSYEGIKDFLSCLGKGYSASSGSPEEEGVMTSRTIFLTRLIGLYCILVIPSMVLHRQATVDWMTALLNNAALMWVLSVITLTIGLAMVLAHNVWSGGALPVVVTLVGWAALIKGLLFLFLPSGIESEFILSALRNPLLFYIWMTPSLVIGIYLTYGGFASKATHM